MSSTLTEAEWKWIEDQMASSDEDSVEEMQYAESSTLTEAQLRAKEAILKQREQKRLAENSKEVEVIEIDPHTMKAKLLHPTLLVAKMLQTKMRVKSTERRLVIPPLAR